MRIPAIVSRQGRHFRAKKVAAPVSEAVEMTHRQRIDPAHIIGSKARDIPGLVSLRDLKPGFVRLRFTRSASSPIAGSLSELTVR